MKKARRFHFAFKTEYGGITRELRTEIKIKLPSSMVGRTNTGWIGLVGLWDTGATHSVITKSVVDRLKLIPTGKTMVFGINTSELRDTFMVDIGLPNRVAIPDVTVTECVINSPGIDVIIGMNIIQLGDFSISNGPGKTFFSFAIPPFPNPVDLLAKSIAVNPKKR